MPHKTAAFILGSILSLGSLATASVFTLTPDSAFQANYLDPFFPGESSALPERIDPATLGGTDRILSQVTVYVNVFDLFPGTITADFQVKFYDDAGTFANEIWASSISDNVSFTGDLNPVPLTFNAVGITVLPETLYYGVVISDVQGSFPVFAGVYLTDSMTTPSSDAAPAPSIPVDNYWVLSGDNSTYTASTPGQTNWVAIEIIAVPEPATWLMAGLALATAFVLRKRR